MALLLMENVEVTTVTPVQHVAMDFGMGMNLEQTAARCIVIVLQTALVQMEK
jgi:hypothetical protein